MTTKEISKYEISFSKDFRDYLKSEYGEGVFEDLQDFEINEKSIFYTAGDKNGRETVLLNLPTCESCEYWRATGDKQEGWGHCMGGEMSEVCDDSLNPEFYQSHKCFYHSLLKSNS